jgi:hypothetical protein
LSFRYSLTFIYYQSNQNNYLRSYIKKHQIKDEEKQKKKNPEKLAAPGTRRRKTKQKHRETGSTGYKTKKNKTKTIQRNVLPVSLDSPFLIVISVFSNVYLLSIKSK